MEVEAACSAEQSLAKTPPKKNKNRIESSESEDGDESIAAAVAKKVAESPAPVKTEANDNGNKVATKDTPKTETKTPTKKTPVKKETPKETPKKVKKETPVKKAPIKKETPKKVKKESSEPSEPESSFEDEKPAKKTPAKKTPTKETPTKKTPTKKTPTKETPTKKTPAKTPTKTERTPARKRKNEDADQKPAKRAKKEKGEEAEAGWWEEDDQSWKVGDKKNWKWRTLRHNGVVFPPPYEPHGVKMKYNGKEVDLTDEQEELATFFARYMETDHMLKPQFARNFFEGFKKALGPKSTIKDYSKCDFTPILEYLKTQKEERLKRTKEEKEKEKKEKAEIKEKYGTATVDNRKEQIGNYMVEPPGLFLGRGDHPKAGELKRRVMPEDVTLNLDEDAPVPLCPLKGHKWGGIVHNHEVMWLACWKENVKGTPKYVLFSANSSLRGRSDRKKFEVAKQLKSCVKDIRKTYMAELKSDDVLTMQRATALWVIDHLALRVGNDKNSKEEADTVGCCSLRVEHIKLHKPNKVEFDFLGKDSMPYKNTVEVDDLVFKNFEKMMKGKKKSEDVFDQLNPGRLNQHLSSLMPGLSAKVFRTYNASYTMQEELAKYDAKKFKNYTPDQKLLFFNQASVQVAILCNHQRTVSKTHGDQIAKMDSLIEDTKEEINLLKKHIKALKEGKKVKLPKTEEGEKKVALPASIEATENKIKKLQERINRTETKKKDKDQLKEVSTSTSKVNYIDPRVTLAWCKKVDLDPKKVFPMTLRSKFAWAIAEVDDKPDFVF